MYKIVYYTNGLKNPILDFFESLPKKDVAKILKEIDLLEEFGLSLGMPYIKKLVDSDGIWELRVKLSSNSYRVFYFNFERDTFVLLHAFQKKTNKTPPLEISKAISRKNEFLNRR